MRFAEKTLLVPSVPQLQIARGREQLDELIRTILNSGDPPDKKILAYQDALLRFQHFKSAQQSEPSEQKVEGAKEPAEQPITEARLKELLEIRPSSSKAFDIFAEPGTPRGRSVQKKDQSAHKKKRKVSRSPKTRNEIRQSGVRWSPYKGIKKSTTKFG